MVRYHEQRTIYWVASVLDRFGSETFRPDRNNCANPDPDPDLDLELVLDLDLDLDLTLIRKSISIILLILAYFSSKRSSSAFDYVIFPMKIFKMLPSLAAVPLCTVH